MPELVWQAASSRVNLAMFRFPSVETNRSDLVFDFCNTLTKSESDYCFRCVTNRAVSASSCICSPPPSTNL